MKPDGWNDDAPSKIPDPTAAAPEDWDEDEDGEWAAPLVPNPDCAVGCGEWKAPTIQNPEYKGKWRAPKIDNPAYKGEFKPKQIDNLKYYHDPQAPHPRRPRAAASCAAPCPNL